MEKKIVFINQWSNHSTKDIVNAFSTKYDVVALIAGTISQSGRPLDKKVEVHRIMKYKKRSVLTRLISWMVASIQIIFLVKTKFRDYHLFLVSNPPTTAFLPSLCRNSYSVQILDIYPDTLVASDFISEKSWLNKVWRNQNIKYFSGATNLFTISNGMAKTMSQYCDLKKIKVIHLWPPVFDEANIERSNNKFILSHSLSDKFIVMYSGNIGVGHHVEILVEVAALLRDRHDIIFTIIGDGFNKPLVENKIRDYQLQNCLVLPMQETELFQHSSRAGDIGVVSVSKDMASLMIPSKTYNIINNQIPVLCITEGKSELSELVSNYNIGKCFAPSQIEEIAEYIVALKQDERRIRKFKTDLASCAGEFTSINAYKYLDE